MFNIASRSGPEIGVIYDHYANQKLIQSTKLNCLPAEGGGQDRVLRRVLRTTSFKRKIWNQRQAVSKRQVMNRNLRAGASKRAGALISYATWNFCSSRSPNNSWNFNETNTSNWSFYSKVWSNSGTFWILIFLGTLCSFEPKKREIRRSVTETSI